jgi:hypothetical protein
MALVFRQNKYLKTFGLVCHQKLTLSTPILRTLSTSWIVQAQAQAQPKSKSVAPSQDQSGQGSLQTSFAEKSNPEFSSVIFSELLKNLF